MDSRGRIKSICLFTLLWITHLSYAQVFCHSGTETPGHNRSACDTALTTHPYCHTRLAVSAHQTVSFYLKEVTREHAFGTIRVGQSIDDDRCFADEDIVAVTWNENAKRYQTKTLARQSNVGKFVYLSYPRDFKHPFVSDTTVLCQMEILNNSPAYVDFYDEHISARRFLMELNPMQKKTLATPCYLNQSIVALSANTAAEHFVSNTYMTATTYSNVNHFVFLEFPKNFIRSDSILTELLRQHEYQELKEKVEQNTPDTPDTKRTYPDLNVKNHTDGNGHWSIKSGVVEK